MLTAYVAMVIIGVIVLAISLIFGADHGIEHEVDMGHDIGVGHDVEVGHDVDAGHGIETGEVGPGFFSIRLIMAFIIGFGFGGVLGMKALGLYGNQSVLSALPCALVFYYVAYMILKWIYHQQISTHIVAEELVGNDAIVTTEIRQGSYGEVKVECRRTRKSEYFRAKAKSANESFAGGETVKISGYVAGIFEVIKKTGEKIHP